MIEKTPAEELQILRQSIAYFAMQIKVDVPELPVLSMTPDQLFEATKNQNRGWNSLLNKISLSVKKK